MGSFKLLTFRTVFLELERGTRSFPLWCFDFPLAVFYINFAMIYEGALGVLLGVGMHALSISRRQALSNRRIYFQVRK